jgi:hypothetical protein
LDAIANYRKSPWEIESVYRELNASMWYLPPL